MLKENLVKLVESIYIPNSLLHYPYIFMVFIRFVVFDIPFSQSYSFIPDDCRFELETYFLA